MAISLPSTVIFHVSPNIVDLYNQRGNNRYNKPLASGDKPNEELLCSTNPIAFTPGTNELDLDVREYCLLKLVSKKTSIGFIRFVQ